MKVDLITETNSDLTVVNAARCSFDKESTWFGNPEEIMPGVLKNSDVKLINYLAAHKHWTPFGHPQEVFALNIKSDELLHFLFMANLSGFEWVRHQVDFETYIRGSLHAWLSNMHYLPLHIWNGVYEYIREHYPISFAAFFNNIKTYDEGHGVRRIDKSLSDELQSYTLRIHAPIFVKRQLETHRRGFVMTDIEDFAQNEVSRRYVDNEPEFYKPKEWRIQAKDKKQGSSDEKLNDMHRLIARQYYNTHMYNCGTYYDVFNAYSIAHEQSRMVLPLSTYTTWWWTGSLKSWKRMAALRLEEHAQGETRELAQLICEAIPVPLV